MEKSIIILEIFIDENRKNHWNNAKQKFSTINFIHKDNSDQIEEFIKSLEISNPVAFILFGHNSDIENARMRGDLINKCKSRKIPLVLYSGGNNGVHELIELLLDKLSVSVLAENLESFLKQVEHLTAITTNDLGMLASIDPKLEDLLKVFSNTNPFNTDETLKRAKISLQEYINVSIGKK